MMFVFKYMLFGAVLCLSLQTQAQLFKKEKDADELYNEAVQETKQQHYQKAIQLSQQALAKRSNFTDQELLLGRLYLLTGNYELARKYVKKVLEKDPLYKDAYLYAINIEISDKRYEEAACYVDEALYHFAGDRDLMLKKLAILDVAQNFYQGGVYANALLEKNSGDTIVQKAYTGHYLLAGHYYQVKGNSLLAQQNYEKALMLNPENREAKDAITSMYIRSGSYTRAIEQVNAELVANPGSYELMMRKLGLLQDTHDYAEALNMLQVILKRYPNDGKARGMETSLRMEAAA